MTCPAPELLAEAATTGDEAILAHAVSCAACEAVLAGQGSIRAMVQQLPGAPLTRAHRETIAAEVLAHADQWPPLRRARWWPVWTIGVAIAAIVALVVYLPNRRTHAEVIAAPNPVRVPVPDVISTPAPIPAPAPVPAPAPAPVVIAKAHLGGSATFERAVRSDRDLVKLSNGDLTVDAVGTRAVSVVNGDTTVGVRGARVQVVAKRGVISQVSVFAGSAEVTVAGKRVVIEAGMTWDRNASREDSLAAFRTGWEALRAGHNADAIAAFELATDDVVAEDALYWSAIASEREHDDAGAVRRYRALLARFPTSPRADAATAAIARLAP